MWGRFLLLSPVLFNVSFSYVLKCPLMIKNFICDCEEMFIISVKKKCIFCGQGRQTPQKQLVSQEKRKIREEKHRLIRRLKIEGHSQKEIVEQTRLSKQYISWVLRKKNKTALAKAKTVV